MIINYRDRATKSKRKYKLLLMYDQIGGNIFDKFTSPIDTYKIIMPGNKIEKVPDISVETCIKNNFTAPKELAFHQSIDRYNIMYVDDYMIIKKIIMEAQGREKQFNFMDVGTGNYMWCLSIGQSISNDFKNIECNFYGLNVENNEAAAKKCNLSHYRI